MPGPNGAGGDVREIAEMAWLGYLDRHRTSPVDQLIFDHLLAADLLR